MGHSSEHVCVCVCAPHTGITYIHTSYMCTLCTDIQLQPYQLYMTSPGVHVVVVPGSYVVVYRYTTNVWSVPHAQ